MSRTPSPVRGLSQLGTVALVVGNMVGTSVYTLPATLAKACGPLGIVACLVTAAGYPFLAPVYARLGRFHPRTGGPYVFAREAFGELPVGAAVAAGLGTLNGWILMAGRIPVSAAQDGILFRGLGRIHPRWRTPHVSLLAGGLVASAVLGLGLSQTLLERFDAIVRFSVLLTLVPHLASAAAGVVLARRDPDRYPAAERRRTQAVAAVAFAFSLFTVYGLGREVVAWGVLALLAGLPLYVAFKARADRTDAGRR